MSFGSLERFRNARAFVALLGLALAVSSTGCGTSPSPIVDLGADLHVADAASMDFAHALGSTDLASGCPTLSPLVYTIEADGLLSRFDPANLEFTDIGKLACPAMPNAAPYGITVDRKGVAWVIYTSGELFHVDTVTSACTATSLAPDQLGFRSFSLSFAPSAPGSPDDVLYYASQNEGAMAANSIGRIDLGALTLARTADVAGYPSLAGGADGKLWGYFPDATAPRVAAIDPATGQLSPSYPLPALQGQHVIWAFATWLGEFWIFVTHQGESSTRVYRLHADGKTLTIPLYSTGRHIVGAGTSVCGSL